MNLDAVSQMPFGDPVALAVFVTAHRLAHDQIASALQTKGRGTTPATVLDSDAATQAWIGVMAGGERAPALADWLERHANLHQAEYDLLKLGQAPDLSQVDFGQPEQFYEWLSLHQLVHTQVSGLLGVT